MSPEQPPPAGTDGAQAIRTGLPASAAEPVRSPDAATHYLADRYFSTTVPWKVTLRLIPFIFVLYVLNILDRINVGFAALQMQGDINLGEQAFALGSGIFYIGYFLFEVPSNLILKRVGARRWIGRIMISWGIISTCMLFVTGPWSFCVLRFLLGLAEAGFFPGIILYLSFWFPARERARAVSRFMAGSALVGILGSLLSGSILQYLNGAGGLAGWQWVFLIEGVPSVVMGVVTLFYLTDRPEEATWLEPAERDWLAGRMAQEEQRRVEHQHLTLLQALGNGRVWLLCAIYFSVAMASNTFGMYGPKILDNQFQGASKVQIGFLMAVPSLAAMVTMILVGMHSDRTGERRWHVAGTAFLTAAGWLLAAVAPVPGVALLGLVLAQMGAMSMLAPFWALPTSFLSGAAAAGGIALINSIGNLGGFAGPNVIGQLMAFKGSYAYGELFVAGAMVMGGCLALCTRHDPHLEKHEAPFETAGDPVRGIPGRVFAENVAVTAATPAPGSAGYSAAPEEIRGERPAGE
jgi:ACS family tartrate transporter-like MFS transporter